MKYSMAFVLATLLVISSLAQEHKRIPASFPITNSLSNEWKSMRVKLQMNTVWDSNETIPSGSTLLVRSQGKISLGRNETRRGSQDTKCPSFAHGMGELLIKIGSNENDVYPIPSSGPEMGFYTVQTGGHFSIFVNEPLEELADNNGEYEVLIAVKESGGSILKGDATPQRLLTAQPFTVQLQETNYVYNTVCRLPPNCKLSVRVLSDPQKLVCSGPAPDCYRIFVHMESERGGAGTFIKGVRGELETGIQMKDVEVSIKVQLDPYDYLTPPRKGGVMIELRAVPQSNPTVTQSPTTPSTTRPSIQGEGGFTVQVASYNNETEANETANRLRSTGLDAQAVKAEIVGRGTWYRIQIGHFGTQEAADRYGARLRAEGAIQSYTVVRVQKIREITVSNQSQQPSDDICAATFAGDLAKVKLLLASGANIDEVCEIRRTPLMNAASGASAAHTAILQILLNRGAKVDAMDNNQMTALMQAVIWGRVNNVRILLGRSADVTAVDEHGASVLVWAERGKSNEIVQLIRSALARSNNDTIIINGVRVKDFYKKNEGNYDCCVILLIGTNTIQFDKKRSAFQMSAMATTPNEFKVNRRLVENQLLNILGITQSDACKLRVTLTKNAPGGWDGMEYGLSFCR